MSARIRLVVFDWDGTLIDSIGAIVSCTEAALEELGHDPVPPVRIRKLIGLGLTESIEHLCPGADERTAAELRRSADNRIRLHNDPQCAILRCLAQISANVVPTSACESSRRGEATGFGNLGWFLDCPERRSLCGIRLKFPEST